MSYMSNNFFTISSLFYIVLLNIVFFSKPRVKNIETRIYQNIIICNLATIVTAIISSFTIRNIATIPLLNEIVSKFLLITFFGWGTLFSSYLYVITFEDKIEKIKKNQTIISITFILISFIICIFPLNYFNENSIIYSYGPAANITYLISGIYVFFNFICLIIGFKKGINKKYIPLIIYDLFGTVVIILQKINPQLLLVSSMETFVTFLMYFTIENPDMKLINELELAKSNAEKANLAKTEFLSSMSHEIRTPLNAIVGFSNAILEDEKITEAQEEARDIVMASQNLLEIVNGILDISKIEAGKMEIVETDYNLKEMCDNIIKLVTPRILEKPIEIKSSYSKDLPAIFHGDMGKVKEIITNIMTNAAKYTDEGSIELSISCINSRGKSNLIISIEDTGRGIKPEKIDKLFTKFQRLEEDKNTTLEGTGLGLAITKSLVEMMGGKIVVQSKYGSGSKFTVYLSQKIVSMNDIKKEISGEQVEEKIDYSKKKILVVDDNNLNLKVAIRLLDNYKIKPDTCTSGFECIEIIKEKKYDLILLDDMMPKMSGVETFKRIKENEDFKTPVVILTANAIAGMKEKYMSDGFNDYLAKPIDKLELERVLKKYLKK